MKEKRKHPRIKATNEVMINHPEYGRVMGCMRDMSESGIFVELDPSMRFECGQVFGVHIIGISDVDIDPLLPMEVVRVELTGIALRYGLVTEKRTEPSPQIYRNH